MSLDCSEWEMPASLKDMGTLGLPGEVPTLRNPQCSCKALAAMDEISWSESRFMDMASRHPRISI